MESVKIGLQNTLNTSFLPVNILMEIIKKPNSFLESDFFSALYLQALQRFLLQQVSKDGTIS